VVALGASVELGGWLVPTPCLQEPPERLVVSALRAFDLRCWEGAELRFLVSYDLDLGSIGELLLCRLFDRLSRRLAGISAVVADECNRDVLCPLYLLELEACAALWAEL